nr:MAG TPA: hypothetical protein [Caudoviricetes sp.]
MGNLLTYSTLNIYLFLPRYLPPLVSRVFFMLVKVQFLLYYR